MDSIVLKFLCLQIVEKILRMEQFLTAARTLGARSDLEVISTFERHLMSIRSELFEAMTQLWRLNDDLLKVTLAPLLKWIQSCFHSVDELHLHLSYIHGPWTTPETAVFVEALFGPVQKRKNMARNGLSVVLSDVLMFEEADLTTYLAPTVGSLDPSSPATPTLFLPKAEIDNPLQWAPLIHEMGHAVAPTLSQVLNDDEINLIITSNPASRQVLADWTEEVFCDFLSLQLLGPAYLASFVDFVTLTGSEGLLQGASSSHPPAPFRIASMFSNLERKDIVCKFEEPIGECQDLATFFSEVFDARCRMERLYFSIKVQEPTMFSIDVPAFSTHVESRVREKLPIEKTVRGFDQDKFRYLKKRLDESIPIGAYSAVEIKEGDEKATLSISTLRSEVSKDTPDQQILLDNLNILRNRVRESPCTVAEIINAGWLYKCERIYFEAIRGNTFNATVERVFRDKLFALDNVLKNSIETSFLHSMLARGIMANNDE